MRSAGGGLGRPPSPPSLEETGRPLRLGVWRTVGEPHFFDEYLLEMHVFIERNVPRLGQDFGITAVVLVQAEEGELGAEQSRVPGGLAFLRREIQQPDAPGT